MPLPAGPCPALKPSNGCSGVIEIPCPRIRMDRFWPRLLPVNSCHLARTLSHCLRRPETGRRPCIVSPEGDCSFLQRLVYTLVGRYFGHTKAYNRIYFLDRPNCFPTSS